MQILALESATTHVSASLLRYRAPTDAAAQPEHAPVHAPVNAPGSAPEFWQRVADLPRAASESLLELVDAVLADGQTSLAEVDLLATSVGPGMFTGVRIAIATLHGLALAQGCPVVGVDTLAAVALGAARAFETGVRGLEIAVLMDARREEVYTGAYRFAASDQTSGHPENALTLAARLSPVASPALSEPGRAWATLDKALDHALDNALGHDKRPGTTTQPNPQHMPRLAVGSGIGLYRGLEPSALSEAGAHFLGTEVHPEAENVALLAAVLAARGKTLALSELAPLYLRPAVD